MSLVVVEFGQTLMLNRDGNTPDRPSQKFFPAEISVRGEDLVASTGAREVTAS